MLIFYQTVVRRDVSDEPLQVPEIRDADVGLLR
jgi:hypothetical protein